MPKVKINQARCKGCRLCVTFCPSGAIAMETTLNEHGIFCAKIIDDGKCTGCGFCFLMCPDACIEIRDVE